MLMIVPGTKNGEIFRSPPPAARCVSSIIGRPPIPEPIETPHVPPAYSRDPRP